MKRKKKQPEFTAEHRALARIAQRARAFAARSAHEITTGKGCLEGSGRGGKGSQARCEARPQGCESGRSVFPARHEEEEEYPAWLRDPRQRAWNVLLQQRYST